MLPFITQTGCHIVQLFKAKLLVLLHTPQRNNLLHILPSKWGVNFPQSSSGMLQAALPTASGSFTAAHKHRGLPVDLLTTFKDGGFL